MFNGNVSKIDGDMNTKHNAKAGKKELNKSS